jgi:2-dehydropantoate 2-reductase
VIDRSRSDKSAAAPDCPARRGGARITGEIFGVRERHMGKKIVIVGAGAVGGYTGAHMTKAGEDVTFIDGWPEHVETMKKNGLTITHHQGDVPFTVRPGALHLTEVQHLSKEAPVDIAFVCTKSYDTAWATLMIRQYLAPTGFVVSLQNCMNEATIAEIVGWGKVLGCIASNISVGLVEPGHVHRGGLKGGAAHTVYRCGEVNGRITERANEVLRLVSMADSAKATDNLWGERWSKLVTNSMANGCSAATGLSGAQMAQNEVIRRFQARLGSEAIRIGQALGYKLEEINHLPPEVIVGAGEGDSAALGRYEDRLATQRRGSAEQRPSMGQDMAKGRRTEIEFLNGFVVREGERAGLPARANERLVDIVKKVERGDLKQDPRHITELRLN